MVMIDRSLVFPSVSHVRNIIEKAGIRRGEGKWPVVLDGSRIFTTDYTAAQGFKAMAKDFDKRGQSLIFYNLKPSVESVFQRSGGHVLTIAQSQDKLHEILRGMKKSFINHAYICPHACVSSF